MTIQMTQLVHNVFDIAGSGVLTWLAVALVLSGYTSGYSDELEEDLNTVKLCALIAAITVSLVVAINLKWS